MELQWNICPHCGNDHIDPYYVGPQVVLADDLIAEEEAQNDSGDDEEAIPEDDFIVSEEAEELSSPDTTE